MAGSKSESMTATIPRTTSNSTRVIPRKHDSLLIAFRLMGESPLKMGYGRTGDFRTRANGIGLMPMP
jgi:hypothetical protein